MADCRDTVCPDPDQWDVIVVGTGMGGGTLGLRLAERGLKVLFLEKGRADVSPRSPSDAAGCDADARLREGRWPGEMTTTIDGRTGLAEGVRGCGVGGSTRLYAAVLERLEPHDFTPTPDLPHPAGSWPVSGEAMASYYEEAESLFRVSGTHDPLSRANSGHLLSPPNLATPDRQLFDDFSAAGLDPYRCHVGIAYKAGCRECLGYACPSRCKSDTSWLCVEPAVRNYGAELRVECDVQDVETDETSARSVGYLRHGVSHRASARFIVLAAGALETPRLLLASANRHHPSGVANSTGLVGRNLMFHGVNWLAVWPSRRLGAAPTGKSIASRAFYSFAGQRGGVIQSMARSAGYGEILAYLHRLFDRSPLRSVVLLRPLLRVVAKILEFGFGRATIFAVMIEDHPYPDNRIEVDERGRPHVVYRIRPELKRRNADLCRLVRRKLSRNRHIWLNHELLLNEGHACGTCRFGSDPAASVLDASCRAHDLDNLYVADASFMPSSGGANPGLTIAANALRVADLIARRFVEEPRTGRWAVAAEGD